MDNNITLQKAKAFSVRIIKLYKHLTDVKREFILSKQLLRSGTSIGANITEALCGIRKKDFLAKMYIAFKESAESQYWLELLHEAEYLTDQEFLSIFADCRELRKLLSSITKTTAENLKENS